MEFNGIDDASQSQWLNLISSAEVQAGYQFNDTLKQYLVMTLQYYTTELTLPDSIITIDYMEALNQSGIKQSNELRNIGDQCMLLTGLFPERLQKKQLSLDYTITIGKQSYLRLALENHLQHFDKQIFHDLQKHFVGLVDILYVMRHVNDQ